MKTNGYCYKAAIVFIMVLITLDCNQYAAVQNTPINAYVERMQGSIRENTSVKISYPENNLITSKEEIPVIASIVPGEPIESATLFVNNTTIKTIETRQTENTIPVEFLLPIALGQSKIKVVARSVSGKITSEEIEISRIKPIEMANQVVKNRWAVVVGISEYQHAKEGIPPLKYAHNDAQSFMDFLYSPNGGGFKPDNTKLLLDEQATANNIRSSLFTFLKKAEKDDLVIIYFAGHGAPEMGRPDNLYLITYDTDPNDLASTAFPMWDMETALKRYIVADRVLILADACHSGGVGQDFGTRSFGNANLINSYLANLDKTKPGRAIMTASETNQLSHEGEQWGHGVFTYYLLEALKGKADTDGDGIVTIAEAFKYVYDKVRSATESQQHPTIRGKYDAKLPMAVTR